MKVEEIIIGASCIFWGIFAFFNRAEFYQLAREDGRRIHDIRFIKPLLLISTAILPVVGIILIILSFL